MSRFIAEDWVEVVSSSFQVRWYFGEDVLISKLPCGIHIYAAISCYVVLTVATIQKLRITHFMVFAIGLVVMSGAITVGPISRSIQSAVALGLSISGGFSNLGYGMMVSASNH
jgi:hypothetical protein